jgi:hypothetical protein
MTHHRPQNNKKDAKNELIISYKKVDLIKHPDIKSDLLWNLQCQKEKIITNLDELREFNERIYPQSPKYGLLYED